MLNFFKPKYHICEDMIPRICRAKIKDCPYSKEEHFSSIEQAQAHIDKLMEIENEIEQEYIDFLEEKKNRQTYSKDYAKEMLSKITSIGGEIYRTSRYNGYANMLRYLYKDAREGSYEVGGTHSDNLLEKLGNREDRETVLASTITLFYNEFYKNNIEYFDGEDIVDLRDYKGTKGQKIIERKALAEKNCKNYFSRQVKHGNEDVFGDIFLNEDDPTGEVKITTKEDAFKYINMVRKTVDKNFPEKKKVFNVDKDDQSFIIEYHKNYKERLTKNWLDREDTTEKEVSLRKIVGMFAVKKKELTVKLSDGKIKKYDAYMLAMRTNKYRDKNEKGKTYNQVLYDERNLHTKLKTFLVPVEE